MFLVSNAHIQATHTHTLSNAITYKSCSNLSATGWGRWAFAVGLRTQSMHSAVCVCVCQSHRNNKKKPNCQFVVANCYFCVAVWCSVWVEKAKYSTAANIDSRLHFISSRLSYQSIFATSFFLSVLLFVFLGCLTYNTNEHSSKRDNNNNRVVFFLFGINTTKSRGSRVTSKQSHRTMFAIHHSVIGTAGRSVNESRFAKLIKSWTDRQMQCKANNLI